MAPAKYSRIFLSLPIAAVALFIGYAWLCFSGKTPHYVFFWDEKLLGAFVSNWLGMSWDEYATNPAVSRHIDRFITGAGVFFLLCGAAVFGLRRFPAPAKILLILGSVQILLLAVLHGIDRHFFLVQFSEYALQWSCPLFLLLAARREGMQPAFNVFGVAAAAVTFAAHGLYAAGVFPRPGHFTEMTMSILHFGESGANRFLTVVGILDLLAAAALFIPIKKLQMAAVGYMVVWGFLTAMARWVAHVDFSLPWWSEAVAEWTPEVLVRFPHFLVPLFLWGSLQRK
ncbi:MAG: hypothetical protein KF852_18745 [Saprospiraceae bacterium]|nr:hypothetical protein [Saprospiraceae bacterium]